MKNADELDRVLFNPKRFMIAVLLYLRGPSTIAELQKALELSWGDLDSNVRRLKEAGYVNAGKVITLERPKTMVKLTQEGRMRLERLMDGLERLLRAVKSSNKDQH